MTQEIDLKILIKLSQLTQSDIKFLKYAIKNMVENCEDKEEMKQLIINYAIRKAENNVA